mgnify:CR=1 FL=1
MSVNNPKYHLVRIGGPHKLDILSQQCVHHVEMTLLGSQMQRSAAIHGSIQQVDALLLHQVHSHV